MLTLALLVLFSVSNAWKLTGFGNIEDLIILPKQSSVLVTSFSPGLISKISFDASLHFQKQFPTIYDYLVQDSTIVVLSSSKVYESTLSLIQLETGTLISSTYVQDPYRSISGLIKSKSEYSIQLDGKKCVSFDKSKKSSSWTWSKCKSSNFERSHKLNAFSTQQNKIQLVHSNNELILSDSNKVLFQLPTFASSIQDFIPFLDLDLIIGVSKNNLYGFHLNSNQVIFSLKFENIISVQKLEHDSLLILTETEQVDYNLVTGDKKVISRLLPGQKFRLQSSSRSALYSQDENSFFSTSQVASRWSIINNNNFQGISCLQGKCTMIWSIPITETTQIAVPDLSKKLLNPVIAFGNGSIAPLYPDSNIAAIADVINNKLYLQLVHLSDGSLLKSFIWKNAKLPLSLTWLRSQLILTSSHPDSSKSYIYSTHLFDPRPVSWKDHLKIQDEILIPNTLTKTFLADFGPIIHSVVTTTEHHASPPSIIFSLNSTGYSVSVPLRFLNPRRPETRLDSNGIAQVMTPQESKEGLIPAHVPIPVTNIFNSSSIHNVRKIQTWPGRRESECFVVLLGDSVQIDMFVPAGQSFDVLRSNFQSKMLIVSTLVLLTAVMFLTRLVNIRKLKTAWK